MINGEIPQSKSEYDIDNNLLSNPLHEEVNEEVKKEKHHSKRKKSVYEIDPKVI